MPHRNQLLIVVADGGHVRFVRLSPESNALHSSSRVIPADGRKAEAGHKDAATHHAQHSHDPRAHEKAEFANWVAIQLNQDSAAYDTLVLVAPPQVMNVVTQHLDVIATAKLIGRREKDLTKLSDHDLSPHLQEWVRPVHRAALL
jgi:protein required for attachment to host cells